MTNPKVFGIGFHKTGKTSLGHALERLGYRVAGPQGIRCPKIARDVGGLAFEHRPLRRVSGQATAGPPSCRTGSDGGARHAQAYGDLGSQETLPAPKALDALHAPARCPVGDPPCPAGTTASPAGPSPR